MCLLCSSPMTADYNEEQLVNEFRRGNSSAFGIIYEHYKNNLCNYCYSVVKDKDVAEDIVHDVFLRIWDDIQTLNDPLSFRSWIFTIARHRALNYLRDRKPLDELSEALQDNEGSVLDSLVNQEQSSLMDGMLNQLRPAYRELLLLRIEGNLSYAEISAITGLSQSSVRIHLYRARKALTKIYVELSGGKE